MTLSKWLAQIYYSLDKYPNSGMAARQLDRYYKALDKTRSLGKYDDVNAMISIVVNIAVKNPRTYPYCMAILSKLLAFCPDKERLKIIEQTREKFKSVPNTGLLDIWLQRVSYKVDSFVQYDEPLTKIVSAEILKNIIWESSWLKDTINNMVSNNPIINRAKLESMTPVIPREEVAL